MNYFSRFIGAFLSVVLTISCSASPLDEAAQKSLKDDVRNEGIELEVYYDSQQRIVFNIESIDGNKSPQDVFRLLLQFASNVHEMKIEPKDTTLSSLGKERFVVPAQHFSSIGEEYGTQNPMYTLRTFPENLQTTDGKAAYEKHQGGFLYLMQVQMNDFNDFMTKWIVEPMSDSFQSELKKPDEFHDDDAFN